MAVFRLPSRYLLISVSYQSIYYYVFNRSGILDIQPFNTSPLIYISNEIYPLLTKVPYFLFCTKYLR